MWGGGAWGAAAQVARAARDLARLVVPVECPGCGLLDEPWCEACVRSLAGPVRRCEEDVPRLDRMDGVAPMPVWAVAAYAGPVRGVVVAWKDRGRVDLTRPITAAARRAGREVGGLLGGPGPVALDVVPVPTTSRARRRRGADLVAGLADAVADGLRDGGVPVRRTGALRRGAAADQVGLGARARARNATGFALRREVRGRLHLLVDDVVTTGATLAACARVLERGGGLVLGAVALAATPGPAAGWGPVPGGVASGIEPIRGDTPDALGQDASRVPG